MNCTHKTPILYGSRIVKSDGYVVWKGQIYTAPELIPLVGQLVKLTEMSAGEYLLISDIAEKMICHAAHIAYACATNSTEHLTPELIPKLQHNGIATLRSKFIIEENSNMLSIHPEFTMILSAKQVFNCTYTVCNLHENGTEKRYAHWVTEST